MEAKTYHAFLDGDRLDWEGDRPPVEPGCRVAVSVRIDPKSFADSPEHRRRRADALRRLRAMNPFRAIPDSVAWQREQRIDRPLPGREP